MVVPFIADQPFWADRLHRAGIAAAPVPAGRVTAGALTSALAEALTRQTRATAIGRIMRTEDGVRRAVDVLEEIRAAGG